MSTKGTILHTPYCHIYHDYAYQHTNKTDIDGQKEVLVIEVDYGFIDYAEYEDQSVIVVEWDSDFASFIIFSCRLLREVAKKSGFTEVDEYIKAVLNMAGSKEYIGIK